MKVAWVFIGVAVFVHGLDLVACMYDPQCAGFQFSPVVDVLALAGVIGLVIIKLVQKKEGAK